MPFCRTWSRGLITLVGATTENPSFEIIAPLLSRTKVLVLKRLTTEDLGKIIDQALTDPERGLGHSPLTIDPEALELLKWKADGDARIALNTLEQALALTRPGGAGGFPDHPGGHGGGHPEKGLALRQGRGGAL